MSVQTMNAVRPDPGVRQERAFGAGLDGVVAVPFDDAERLRPAGGIGYGLLISVPFWLLVAVLLWFYL
jgi:hypothetical protein